MATVQITWDDINDNEDGFHIYRDTAPLDTANPENLPAPLASVAAGVGSYDDTTAAGSTTYYYAVAAYKGDFVNPAVDIQVDTADPYAGAQVGDETGGGYYAGTDTIDGTDYHIISGKEDSRLIRVAWKTTQTTTPNTTSATDGLANTNAMVAAGIADHPAAQHCVNYEGGGFTDWHLPARSQLALIYTNLAGQTTLFTKVGSDSDYLWTSTEQSANNAWFKKTDGAESGTTKDRVGSSIIEMIALPVRRVPV